MSIPFPSMEFLRALMEQVAEGSDALEAVGDDDFMFGIDADQNMFMIEFADRACVAVAPGGNPNDLDFVLSGSAESWIRALSAAEDAKEFDSLVRRGGVIEVECVDDHGYDRFTKVLPALRTFFAGARTLDWSAG